MLKRHQSKNRKDPEAGDSENHHGTGYNPERSGIRNKTSMRSVGKRSYGRWLHTEQKKGDTAETDVVLPKIAADKLDGEKDKQ